MDIYINFTAVNDVEVVALITWNSKNKSQIDLTSNSMLS